MTGVTTRTVLQDESDIRLDRWLRRHHPGLTQSLINRLCRTGRIRVDGKKVEASARLEPGQTVRIPPLGEPDPARAIPTFDERLRGELEALVLYRDDDLIVVNKPAGLATQGGPGIVRHLDGLLEGFREHEHKPRLVHRLDRDTSGVLVVARSPGVAAKLAGAFRDRDMEKIYWAVVVGRPVPVEGRIDRKLLRWDGFQGVRAAIAAEDDPEAARAITDYRTLDHAARKLAWLELRPLTGRTHQLRAHCAAIGAPILGDAPYGSIRDGHNTALVEGLPAQLHLHARRLVLPHPSGGTLAVEAELPPHMAATFRTLGFTIPPVAPPERRR
jgi:23S rRNA pseudouridine955/2504/2580 synthase